MILLILFLFYHVTFQTLQTDAITACFQDTTAPTLLPCVGQTDDVVLCANCPGITCSGSTVVNLLSFQRRFIPTQIGMSNLGPIFLKLRVSLIKRKFSRLDSTQPRL